MENMQVGNVVSGIVSGIKSYGIFVKLDDGYSGLIHISKITDKFVKNVEDYAKEGEKIYVEIEEVDHDTKHCVLTVKDLNYRIEEKPLIHPNYICDGCEMSPIVGKRYKCKEKTHAFISA